MQPLEIFGVVFLGALCSLVASAYGTPIVAALVIGGLVAALAACRITHLACIQRNREAAPAGMGPVTPQQQLQQLVREAFTGNRELDGKLADELYVSYPTLRRWAAGHHLPYSPIAEKLVEVLLARGRGTNVATRTCTRNAPFPGGDIPENEYWEHPDAVSLEDPAYNGGFLLYRCPNCCTTFAIDCR